MEAFGQSVQGWQTFYATIAASSATLVGLLFVAVSLNLKAVNLAKNAGMRLLARQTFTTFLYLIGIALTFLIPNQDRFGLGPTLVTIATLGLVVSLRELRAARAKVTPTTFRQLLRRSGLKIAAFIALIVIAILMMIGADVTILYWMLTPVLFLLFSASYNTWSLLIAVQEASARG
jgi:hypothetical protein